MDERPIRRITEPLPRDIELAMRLAEWLDDRYIDPIVGLVLPGAGDVLTTLVGLYPVAVALRRRMPAVVVARMMRNLGIDLTIGIIPIFGDAFDFVYKAHRKNADLLLERHVLGPSPAEDWIAVVVSAVVLVVLLALPFIGMGLVFAHFAR
jgi:hypothetical protein